ncbi:MAG TPA: DUF1800 domain-containing protein [Verrucomicrobiae bacterium]|jgi:uncharacterized protein (DUF1800 family)|nr:DUF1800 domain-containing protein [Verrucomicrobiae bacterium]
MSAARKLWFLVLAIAFFVPAGLLMAGDDPVKTASPQTQMDENKRVLQALNRFTFGPRPGDAEKVRALGLDPWFEQQLYPEKIDNAAMEGRLAPFRTLKMSTRQMVESFPPPQVARMVENGRMSMPSDPGERAIYESRIAAYKQQQARKNDAPAADAKDTKADMKVDGQSDAQMTQEQRDKRQKEQEAAMYAEVGAVQLLEIPPEERYQKILKMHPNERLDLAQSLKGEKVMDLVDGMSPPQRETVLAIVQPQAVVGGELAEAKLLRAIYSDRQLEEVMTDFWYNHFNVFIGKGPDRYMITAYERDVIRPHVFGKFKELLVATAQSPAMLFYLDNWQSVGPKSALAKYGPAGPRQMGGFQGPFGRRRQQQRAQQQAKNRPSGLNENYAREIMELHTLGVDGGYTQKDVTELAKVLTGWTIQDPQRGGDTRYNERAHEPGTKYVLGHEIKEQGQYEGLEMLDILAHHPSTARFVCRKLAMRFVSDNPPQGLVDRMADIFMKKDGDIREVLRTLFHSPEFWAPDTYRAKVKTPLEFVVSSARASGVDIQNALPLVRNLNRMGMPLYGMQPPTGYSTKAETWVNSSALLSRMNFALTLGSGRLPGTTVNPQLLLRGSAPQDPDAALAALEEEILSGDVSSQTHAVMQKRLNDPEVTQRKLDDPDRTPNYGAIAGLIMGSPEFQHR